MKIHFSVTDFSLTIQVILTITLIIISKQLFNNLLRLKIYNNLIYNDLKNI